MAEQFLFDVFLSHSSKDKDIVRDIAERLRNDGIKVWFDEWEIHPGDNIPSKIEEGLEHSRVLVLCISANVLDSEWSHLESYTFRFRDPLNKGRRFIPLRLDTTPIKDSLAQFSNINWLPKVRQQEYEKLLKNCIPLVATKNEKDTRGAAFEKKILSFGHTGSINSVAFSPDGTHALTGSEDNTVRLWHIESSQCIRVMEGHTNSVMSVAWSPDGTHALSGSLDDTLRLWQIETGHCIQAMKGHTNAVLSVTWSSDGTHALTGSSDKTVRLWQVESGQCIRVMEGHSGSILSVAWSPDGTHVLTGAEDKTVRCWQVESGLCIRVVEHTDSVLSVAWSPDGTHVLTGAEDKTVRCWQVESGLCIRVMEGHTNRVVSLAWSPDGIHALSGSEDNKVRCWQVESGQCIRVMEGHSDYVLSVAWSPDGTHALSGSSDNMVRYWQVESGKCIRVLEGHLGSIFSVAWSPNGTYVLTGAEDTMVRCWQVESGQCIRVLEGHSGRIMSVAWSPDGTHALTGSDDRTVRIWHVGSGQCIRVLEGHTNNIWSVAWSPDGTLGLTGSDDKTVRLWHVESGQCIGMLEGHRDSVLSVAWSPDGTHFLTGSEDKMVRLWQVESGQCIRVMEGHLGRIWSVAWSPDGAHALTGSSDNTVRCWQVESGQCIRVLEGHTNSVLSVAWSPDGTHALSGSDDKTVRCWQVKSGQCICVLEGHTYNVWSVAWNNDGYTVWSAGVNGVGRLWDLSAILKREQQPNDKINMPDQLQYTNAKVLLVGDSGVGKTGLSNYLALGIMDEERNLSTDGAWATHWKLPHTISQDGVEREIWLWDFAGQVDYRLVHQLFMDQAAAAVLVFNPQQENPYEGLGQWDKDLQKSTHHSFARLLVAGRVDRGGLVVSDSNMKKFMQERDFHGPLHVTSAKTGQGCNELRDAIIDAINWQNIPTTTTPVRYHRMKQEILHLRDQGIVLISLAELKQRMDMALAGENFTLEELQSVIGLLAGPGMIRRLDIGNLILLKPEMLSRYGAALVRKVRQHPQELGCIEENDLLTGNLDFQDFERVCIKDEEVLLQALLEIVVSNAWCLRLPCDGKLLLTFPSLFRRERPELPHHPNVIVTYRFSGPVDDIYATLVVRLHHTEAFDADQLWKDAADFKTLTGQGLGIKLVREEEGNTRIEIYYKEGVDENSRAVFDQYVYNHLKRYDENIKRLRKYYCTNKKCDKRNQTYTNQDVIDKALAPGGKGKVFCPECGKPILLHDTMELKFKSPEIKEKTRQEEDYSEIKLDNESRELKLVGNAYTITAEAGQIYRGVTNSDHGIDGEIEFKDDNGNASGKRLYIQLKSGDSYLKNRKRDDAEVFQIKPRWAEYWQQQAYTVMLVIMNSKGEIRWMDVSEYLKRVGNNGSKPVTQIVFSGEPFDVMSIRKWRDRLLK
jgi:WD40 repeat protein